MYFINVCVLVLLFDLLVKEGLKNVIVLKVIENLKKLLFVLFGVKDDVKYFEVVNYEDDIVKLVECDVVIEVIVEWMDWKYDLYKKVVLYIVLYVIFVINMLGLLIMKLFEGFLDELKLCFCGVYFFNLLCYMYFVELILIVYMCLEIFD